MVIILPVQGITAVTGTDFWMHLIVPVCNVILFQCVETGISLTRKDTVIAQIPYWLYIIVYYVEVFVIGKENGGWGDSEQAGSAKPEPHNPALERGYGTRGSAYRGLRTWPVYGSTL